MSLASIQYMRIPTSSSSSSASSSSSSNAATFRLTKPSLLTIRSAQADGPLRRPSIATPPVRPSSVPSSPSPIPTPTPTTPTPTPPTPPPSNTVVTLEFQRQVAKELQEYFKQKKLEEANQGPFFGFIAKNEISNGRWAMFGFAVGMLTEYATGSDFVDQVKILLSNFGILDLE